MEDFFGNIICTGCYDEIEGNEYFACSYCNEYFCGECFGAGDLCLGCQEQNEKEDETNEKDLKTNQKIREEKQ